MHTRPIFKIKTYSTAYAKIYIYNKNKITQEILNIIRRIIFATTQGSSIIAININNKATEFSYITETEEDILSIVINIKDVKLLIKNCKQLQLKIKKTGKCFLKAKDIAIQTFCKVFNTHKIIAKINHNKTINIKITINKHSKITNSYLNPNINLSNTIKVNTSRSPIKRIALNNHKKHPFIKIHTNNTVCPINCFIKANNYLIERIPLTNGTAKSKIPLIYKNKTLFKNITTTTLNTQLKTLLRLNKITTIIEALRFNNNIAYIPIKRNYKTLLIIELLKQGFHTIK
ncbi:hypothetical protein ACWNX2_00805 [Candidatus Vidania fulgoroideorum]